MASRACAKAWRPCLPQAPDVLDDDAIREPVTLAQAPWSRVPRREEVRGRRPFLLFFPARREEAAESCCATCAALASIKLQSCSSSFSFSSFVLSSSSSSFFLRAARADAAGKWGVGVDLFGRLTSQERRGQRRSP